MDRTKPTPEEYATSICSTRADAAMIPFVEVALDGWTPQIADCHANVDRWVAANPGCEAVRGWVSYISFGPAGEELTAHSVVRNPDGALIDITPVWPGAPRGGAFIEHGGDTALFFAMKVRNIHCPSLDPEADAAALRALIEGNNHSAPATDLEEWQ